jgi:hypothetical protein
VTPGEAKVGALVKHPAYERHGVIIHADAAHIRVEYDNGFLKPGELLQPIVKGQGLKKGETVAKIGGPIRVVNVSRSPLNAITPQDVFREGFPAMTKADFVTMFKKSHRGCRVATIVTRIEFEYTA